MLLAIKDNILKMLEQNQQFIELVVDFICS